MAEREFTAEEHRRLQWLLENEDKIKQLVDKDEKVSWAIATLRNVAMYLAGLIGAWYAIKEFWKSGGAS